LKANAAEVLNTLAENRQPLIITQNGEAKAILQDIKSFEQTQETLALLKILALGKQQIADGKVTPYNLAAKRLRTKMLDLKTNAPQDVAARSKRT
jgi:prevent-host-death family protein